MNPLSVIIPVKDEEESLPTLYDELVNVVEKITKEYEIIFIDDGSEDGSVSVIKSLQKRNNRIKLIEFRGNFGKSAALSAGFELAKYDTLVTLDADLQDDPHELPKMLKKLSEGYDLVSGWRKKR